MTGNYCSMCGDFLDAIGSSTPVDPKPYDDGFYHVASVTFLLKPPTGNVSFELKHFLVYLRACYPGIIFHSLSKNPYFLGHRIHASHEIFLPTEEGQEIPEMFILGPTVPEKKWAIQADSSLSDEDLQLSLSEYFRQRGELLKEIKIKKKKAFYGYPLQPKMNDST